MAKWDIPNSVIAHKLCTCERCGENYNGLYRHFCPDACQTCGGAAGPSHVCPVVEGRKDDDGYEQLRRVLQLALDQAAKGKGKERHANDKPFPEQPIMEIGRMVGLGYHLGQAMKKAQEASRLPNERARAELLGAINYLAAAYLLLEEQPST